MQGDDLFQRVGRREEDDKQQTFLRRRKDKILEASQNLTASPTYNCQPRCAAVLPWPSMNEDGKDKKLRLMTVKSTLILSWCFRVSDPETRQQGTKYSRRYDCRLVKKKQAPRRAHPMMRILLYCICSKNT